MLVSHQLPFFGKLHQGFLLPDGTVIGQIIEHLRGQHEKATIDHGSVAFGFFLEVEYLTLADIQGTKTARRIGCRERGSLAMALMESQRGSNIDITDTIAVGKAKGFFVLHIISYAS
ncbi:hypothetical protein D3C85_1403120 [compost metagenome]